MDTKLIEGIVVIVFIISIIILGNRVITLKGRLEKKENNKLILEFLKNIKDQTGVVESSFTSYASHMSNYRRCITLDSTLEHSITYEDLAIMIMGFDLEYDISLRELVDFRIHKGI